MPNKDHPPTVDLIRKPEHYAKFAIEPADYAMDNNLPVHSASIVKYVTRAGHKLYPNKNKLQSERIDLEKAMDWAAKRIAKIDQIEAKLAAQMKVQDAQLNAKPFTEGLGLSDVQIANAQSFANAHMPTAEFTRAEKVAQAEHDEKHVGKVIDHTVDYADTDWPHAPHVVCYNKNGEAIIYSPIDEDPENG